MDILIKNKKSFLLLFSLVCLFIPVALSLYPRDVTVKNDFNDSSNYRYPKPQHIIQGFHYDGWNGNEKVITVEADRMSIRKKKLGFFRFGLVNIVQLENASIRLYGIGGLDGQKTDQPDGGMTFKGAFSKEALPAFPAKRIASVEMNAVSVEFYDEKAVVAKISANYATIRIKERKIIFKGNASVIAGPRVLMTDRLSLYPEKAMISTRHRFTLNTPEKQEKGRGLSTDIFLREP